VELKPWSVYHQQLQGVGGFILPTWISSASAVEGLSVTSAPSSQPAALDPHDQASSLHEIELLVSRARRTGDDYYLHHHLGTGSLAPLSWLAICRGAPSWYWRGRGEAMEMAGHGIALELRMKGRESAESAMAIGQDILRRCHLSNQTSSPTLPRLLCGFAFDPQAESDNLWEDFPDAWVVLPRVFCEHRNGQSQWFVVARVTRESTPEDINADLRRAHEKAPVVWGNFETNKQGLDFV